MDSVVLLDLLVPLSIPLQVTLSAVHINHGISPHADQWSRFCRSFMPLERCSIRDRQAENLPDAQVSASKRPRGMSATAYLQPSRQIMWFWRSIWMTRLKP